MRMVLVLGTLCAGVLAVSCKPREFNGSKAQSATDGLKMVPFNAYLLWRDGKGAPALDYPPGYSVREGEVDPDGVFYVANETYWQNNRFLGTTTEGAKVEGSVLTYPVREGRTLVLAFSAEAAEDMLHNDAVQYCKRLGLRLPHIQELLDFCAAGTAKDASGAYKNHRCGTESFWSASVYPTRRSDAWQFTGFYSDVKNFARLDQMSVVRCVGVPQR